MKLLDKISNAGWLGVIYAVLGRIEFLFGHLKRRIEAVRYLEETNYVVRLPFDGGGSILLPEIPKTRSILGLEPNLMRSADFSRSALSEPLLRSIIGWLYENDHIDRCRSIVDIGCWCGDNALAWATLLKSDGCIYAIDPSQVNLEFGQCIAEKNAIQNVRWIRAVCSDFAGEKLGYIGDLEHTKFFSGASENEAHLISQTLDKIVGEDAWGAIGLMHVDVEGFEARVLKGAEEIIDHSRPVVVFEHHLNEAGLAKILQFFLEKDYAIFMVNEVLVNCRLDCRNFIAFPFKVPELERSFEHRQRKLRGMVLPAVPGPSLLPVYESFCD